MGHISYDAGFKKQVVIGRLKLSVMKSDSQFRVASHLIDPTVDYAAYMAGEGKPLLSFWVSWRKFAKPFWRRIGKKYATKPSWVASLKWGPGAGYVGGLTAFFGLRCKGGRVDYAKWSRSAYVGDAFRLGITRNGNGTPYPNW